MSPTSYQTALPRVALFSIELNLGKCQGVCNIPLHLPSDQRLILTFHGGEILNHYGHIVDIDAGAVSYIHLTLPTIIPGSDLVITPYCT